MQWLHAQDRGVDGWGWFLRRPVCWVIVALMQLWLGEIIFGSGVGAGLWWAQPKNVAMRTEEMQKKVTSFIYFNKPRDLGKMGDLIRGGNSSRIGNNDFGGIRWFYGDE